MPIRNQPFRTSSTGDSNFRTLGSFDPSEQQSTAVSAAAQCMNTSIL